MATASPTAFRAGRHKIIPDDRKDYAGRASSPSDGSNGRMVVLVWTPTGAGRRVVNHEESQRP
jgi:hypothetical protein